MNAPVSALQVAHAIEHASLIHALSAAQAEFSTIVKDKYFTVTTKSGEVRKINFADLADVLASVRPILARHGLAILQRTRSIQNIKPDTGVMFYESLVILETCLAHTSGERECSEHLLARSPDAKEFAIALTYARKQQLAALLGIQADDDVDAPDPASLKGSLGKEQKEAGKVAMPESQINQALAEMRDAADNAELRRVYSAAYQHAKAFKDERAMGVLVRGYQDAPTYIRPDAKEGTK